jgi:hypothetical protein
MKAHFRKFGDTINNFENTAEFKMEARFLEETA